MTTAVPPTSPTAFTTGHVGLNVTDLERSVRFYQTVFGFAVGTASAEAGRQFAFLQQGETLVLTLWQQSHDRFAPDRPGLHHLSFQVDGVEHVREVERRLRALGATIHHDGIVPHAEGWESGGVFFEDPDGTRLEVFAPSGVHGHAPGGAAPTCGFF